MLKTAVVIIIILIGWFYSWLRNLIVKFKTVFNKKQ